ncbi:hypothetical protein JTE90_020971 [Oedothorax gibbosus]|uniref:Uncharacterized protein n=1 Tax=Oedothorax gibbosus TaxID=931172 RepID=A0AAV6U8Q2_9ARAC|nr:hypothetical protein JTE90_020971 [Oedothorax gibbosus]
MAGVLRTRQEHVQQMSEEIVKKDVEVEELKSEIQRKLDEREEEKIYHDFVSDNVKNSKRKENQVTEDETDKLRDKFTQTLYKIRQSAEKEAKLLEEKLNSSLN